MSVFGAFKYAGEGMFTISESDLVEVMGCLLKWNVGDHADLFREDNFWYTAESFGYNEAEDIEATIGKLSKGTLNLFFMDGAYYGTELYGGRAWVVPSEKIRATESALKEVDDYIVEAIDTYNEHHDEAKELLAREKAPRRRTWVKP